MADTKVQSPVIEEDDFDLSTLPKANKEQEKEPEQEPAEEAAAETNKTDVFSEENKDAEEKPAEKEAAEEKPAETKDQDDDKSGGDTAGEDQGSEDDIFSDDSPKADDGEIDFATLMQEAGIEAESEVKDRESFLAATKKAIETARQKPDLSGYNEQAQKMIAHLNEKGGDLASFFENPVIAQMNRMLQLDHETRYREVRYAELYDTNGKDTDKAMEALEEEIEGMSRGELKTRAEEIAEQATNLRQQEIVKILGEGDNKLQQAEATSREAKTKEKDTLKKFVDTQENFFGISLSKQAKAGILRDIDNGKFDETVGKTPEASKFFSYMVGRFGEKIVASYADKLKEANRQGFNNASDKDFNALHKTVTKGATGSGHKQESGAKRNFDNLTSDLFGE